MTNGAETSSFPAAAAPDSSQVAAESPGQTPEPAPANYASEASAQQSAASAADRPELIVGAAFAGGFLAALILKRIAR